MHVVAGRTIHLAFFHGHMGGSAHFAFHIFVALVAGLAGVFLHQLAMPLGVVDAVAGRARHVGPVVGAPGPVGAFRIFMAFEAGVGHFRGS